jgi:hypothetical protein
MTNLDQTALLFQGHRRTGTEVLVVASSLPRW